MSRLLSIALLLLLTISVSAQDGLAEKSFSLRQPSAEEYVSAIPEIFNRASVEDNYFLSQSIFTLLFQEARIEYRKELQTINVNDLYNVFKLLFEGSFFQSNRQLWMQAILLTWLEQNPTGLDSLDSFSFEDVHVQVTPRDFNNDGQNEYLLDLQSDLYSQLIVMKSTDSGYEIVDSPLPWYGCCFMYYSPLSGFMEEQYFGDLNNDGLPEWVLAEGGIGGGHMNHGTLFVLQWQDEKIIDISANADDWWDVDVMTYRSEGGGGSPLFPWGVEVSFDDIDANNTIDIVIQQEFNDSWDCISYDTRIFSWDVKIGRYYLSSHSRDFEDSAECNLRQAQDKMWDKDYLGAIPLFERSVELYEQMEFLDEISEYDIQKASAQEVYSRVRLALAYIMTDDMTSAKTIVPDIVEPLEDFQIIISFAETAKQTLQSNPDKVTFCISLYDVFAEFYQNWQANPYWGATDDVPSPWGGAPNSQAPALNPANAGCDAMSYVEDALWKMPSTTLQPINYLEQMNLPVSTYFHSDLNADSVDEWLIWLNMVDSDPILFLSSPQGYQTSYVNNAYLRQPDLYTNWFEWQLPDNKAVWVTLYFDDEHTFDELIRDFISSGGGGPFAFCINQDGDFNLDLMAGDITLFQLTETNELDNIFTASICESVMLNDIFPDGTTSTELIAWKQSSERNTNSHYPIVPVIYIWNEEAGTYIYEELVVQSTVIPQENDELEEVHLDSVSVLKAVDDNEFEAVIDLVNDYLGNVSNISDFSNNITRTAYYYRAFAYEQLGQYNEALADYVTLYTEAPDTAWGMLAGLHIEPTNN